MLRRVTGLDRNGLVILERAACLALLGAHNFGRVAITLGAMPVVLPVTYRLVDEEVVFRTGAGQKLAAATAGNVIAFEIDDMDSISHGGWSVMVTGVARVVDGGVELARLSELGIPRWASQGDDRVVVLPTDRLSGRRLHPYAEGHAPNDRCA